MTREILGIHHVTALCNTPMENLRFYRDVLGLRLVKKTVNFDDPKSPAWRRCGIVTTSARFISANPAASCSKSPRTYPDSRPMKTS